MQDADRGGVELDMCANVALRGPVNILHDPATALPYTQGTIAAVATTAGSSNTTWVVQVRAHASGLLTAARALHPHP